MIMSLLKKLSLAIFFAATLILAPQTGFATVCPASTVTWTQGANTCSGPIQEGDSTIYGDIFLVARQTAGTNHGSAVFQCNNSGNWTVWNSPKCAPAADYIPKPVSTGSADPLGSPCQNASTCTSLFSSCNASKEGQACQTWHCPDGVGTYTQRVNINWTCNKGSVPAAQCAEGWSDERPGSAFSPSDYTAMGSCTSGEDGTSASSTGNTEYCISRTVGSSTGQLNYVRFCGGLLDNPITVDPGECGGEYTHPNCIAGEIAIENCPAGTRSVSDKYMSFVDCPGTSGLETWYTRIRCVSDVTCGSTGTNGTCGSADGNQYSSAPGGSSLCTAGTPSTVAGGAIGPWAWSCAGTGTGTTADCNATNCAPTASAACFAYSSTTTYNNQPATDTASGCTAGTYENVDDSSSEFKWRCVSTVGGSTATAQCAVNMNLDSSVGRCKAYTDAGYGSQPGTDNASGCDNGTFEEAEDSDSAYQWKCLGSNGSATSDDASCTASKSQCIEDGDDDKRVDVYFLADNTGSMGGVIAAVKTKAQYILNQLEGSDPRFRDFDFRYAVGSYYGDPTEGNYLETPYVLRQGFTSSTSAVRSAINQWDAAGGGDRPEGNFYAMRTLAQSSATGWRDGGPAHIIIWLGDAPSHETTVTKSEAINALKARGISALAFNAASYDEGINIDSQAVDIAIETDGVFYNITSLSDTQLADLILDSISTTAENICGGTGGPGDGDGMDPDEVTYSWRTGPWPICVQGCFDKNIYREVSCILTYRGEESITSISRCDPTTMPVSAQLCPGNSNTSSCDAVCNPRVDPECADTCFAAGTKILMADGTEKDIVEIKVDDMVMSYDPHVENAPLQPQRVTHVFLNDPKQTYNIRGTKVTDSHMFMTGSGKMKSIAEMTAEDTVVLKDGSVVPRGDIEKGAVEKVYNFTVENTHAYIADGMRVGNMTMVPAIPEGVYTEERLKKQAARAVKR